MPRAAAVKQWRTDAFWQAKASRLVHFDRASVIAQPLQRQSVLADAGNHIWSVKAVIDGLCDAKVLDGDDGRYVSSLTLLAPKRTTQATDSLHIELVEVTSCGF